MAEIQLRQNLIKACEQGLEPSKIVPLCDRLLNVNKNDTFGLRCKVIALLQSKRVQQAASVAKELAGVTSSKKAAASGRFLLATCHYRENNFVECEKTLLEMNGGQKSFFGAQEQNLLAQAKYNQFKYIEAAEIYETLLTNNMFQDDLERDEILTNLSACYASVADVDKCVATTKRADEAHHYDLLFNHATALTQQGRFREASSVLVSAEKVCILSNELQPEKIDFCKEAPADMIKTEAGAKQFKAFIKDVVAIKVQQAFVAFHLGDRAGSEKILFAVLHTHGSILLGTAAFAAASLNWTALKRHTNFLDSYNKLKQVQQPASAKRMTAEQRESAAYNAFLLSLGVGKTAQARSMAEALIRDFPTGTLGPRALAAVVVSSDPTRAESILKKVFQQQAASKAVVLNQTLTIAQLALERGDVAGALDLASKNDEAMSQPSVITTVLAGYASLANSSNNNFSTEEAEKNISRILALKNVADLVQSKSDFALQVAMSVYARVGRHAEAAALLEKVAAGSKSAEAKAKLLGASVLEYIQARDIPSANRVAASEGSPIANAIKSSASAKYTLAQSESTSLPRDKLAKAGFVKLQQAQQAAAVAGGKQPKGPRKRPGRRIPKPVRDALAEIARAAGLPFGKKKTTQNKNGKSNKKGRKQNKKHDTKKNNNKNAKNTKKPVAAVAAGGASATANNKTAENKDSILNKIDPERWIPWSLRTYVKDMPPRRRLDAKKRRADEQAEKRRAADKRKKAAAAAAAEASPEQKQE